MREGLNGEDPACLSGCHRTLRRDTLWGSLGLSHAQLPLAAGWEAFSSGSAPFTVASTSMVDKPTKTATASNLPTNMVRRDMYLMRSNPAPLSDRGRTDAGSHALIAGRPVARLLVTA